MSAQMALYGVQAYLQVAGGYFASQNIKEAAAINKQVSDMNAQYAELDAFDAEAEGQSQQARYQSVIDQTLGQQQLLMTAKDIDVNYGSASSIQAETKFTGELNLMEIEKQAQEKALGLKNQAMNIRQQGEMNQAQADIQARQVMFSSAMGGMKTLTGYQDFTKDFKKLTQG